jgi:hypothetical protein
MDSPSSSKGVNLVSIMSMIPPGASSFGIIYISYRSSSSFGTGSSTLSSSNTLFAFFIINFYFLDDFYFDALYITEVVDYDFYLVLICLGKPFLTKS